MNLFHKILFFFGDCFPVVLACLSKMVLYFSDFCSAFNMMKLLILKTIIARGFKQLQCPKKKHFLNVLIGHSVLLLISLRNLLESKKGSLKQNRTSFDMDMGTPYHMKIVALSCCMSSNDGFVAIWSDCGNLEGFWLSEHSKCGRLFDG